MTMPPMTRSQRNGRPDPVTEKVDGSASNSGVANGTASSLRHRRRRSSGSASATAAEAAAEAVTAAAHAIRDTAQAVETGVEAAARRLVLLRWDDLPPWRRDNPSIHSGYRPTSNSFRASLHSLLYLHNESVNIWTHLLGAAAVAVGAVWAYGFLLEDVIAPRYATASSADAVVFACFFAGAFCCLGMSATYHMLSNHSEEVAKWGNKLDYTGIVFLIVGSYVPALWYGFFCWAKWLTFYLGAIALLGLGCLVVSWFEHFRKPAWRPYRALMFVGLGLSGVVPVMHGLKFYGYRELNQRMGLSWVLLQGGLYIFGAFLYAVRFPERKWPGAFDIWGSSHQLFHVCVLLAASSHLYGMIKAFDFHHGILEAQC